MTEKLLELYKMCYRFDEGELYQSEEYQKLLQKVKAARTLLARDSSLLASIEAYSELQDDMTELEAQHYFIEGYKMGLAARDGGR